MHLPGLPSLAFLAFLFVVLPWGALRGARMIRARRAAGGASGGGLPASRASIWGQTLANMLLLLGFAWWVGSGFGYDPFAAPPLGPRAYAYAASALGLCFALRALLRALRTPEERRGLVVFALAPRTPGERVLAVLTILAASVAEEVAYRGVAMSILWWATGNPWLAAFLCAGAFAAAHAVQGGKSTAIILAMALVKHALVAVTGTLVLAMAVHAVYDLVAGHQIREEALRMDAAAATP